MKFGISNLSLGDGDENLYKKQLIEFDYIETIFPKINQGYYSTQSIFYGSDVRSFDDCYSTLRRLDDVIDQCYNFGIKIIVFGSSSLRTGNKNNLLSVFKKIDSKLKRYGIFLCVEPNSKYYGGEYYHRISDIVNDIQNFSNIKTMIDTHNLILEGDNIFDSYSKYSSFIKHIHFSEKDLLPIVDYSLYYEFVDFLHKSDYDLGVTYELKYCENVIQECEKFIKLKDKIKKHDTN